MAKTEKNAYLYDGFINEVKGSLNTGVSEESINKSVNEYLDENPVISEQIYSTEERVIGKWINGKPIYRKVINTGEVLINNTWTKIGSISDVECIINHSAIGSGNNTIAKTCPMVEIDSAGNIMAIVFSYDFTISTLIIEYTKTTD